MSRHAYRVCRDEKNRICIEVDENNGRISFIPLCINGFEVHKTSLTSFNERYKPIDEYPIDQACQLFMSYCIHAGASGEVLDYLGRYVNITDEDRTMAESKLAPENKAPAKRAPAKRAPAKKAPAKKAPVKKTDDGYSSAFKMFQGLIMDGKLTDDEIFKEVQDKFNLDDKKRSYVAWYRNYLKKKGSNPPESK